LENNKVARYNLITPDQYNEMHSALTNGFTYKGVSYTGDLSQIAAADNFLSTVVPIIMASQAYKDNGVIVIWTDETEGTNQNDFTHTLTFIVISKLAKGHAYASTKDYTHSSDLATLQKVFGLRANTPTGYLNDAANPQLDGTTDISDMFKPGVIPKSLPKY
jgi:phosphatidylinositol-3-phosphatase